MTGLTDRRHSRPAPASGARRSRRPHAHARRRWGYRQRRDYWNLASNRPVPAGEPGPGPGFIDPAAAVAVAPDPLPWRWQRPYCQAEGRWASLSAGGQMGGPERRVVAFSAGRRFPPHYGTGAVYRAGPTAVVQAARGTWIATPGAGSMACNHRPAASGPHAGVRETRLALRPPQSCFAAGRW